MTVSTEVNQAAYTGNGVTTVFPYTFRILNSNNLTVTRIDLQEVETLLTLGTDYTVTGAGTYNGGAVTLPQPLPSGYSLVIERDLAAVQETDLRNQGTFFAEVHEDVFDYLTMLVQQVTSWLRLALRRPTVKSKFYDAKQYRIANLADPINAQDAVNNQTMLKALADLSTDGSGQFVLQMLASPAPGLGASLVNTESGINVQDSLENIDSQVNKLEANIKNNHRYKVLYELPLKFSAYDAVALANGYEYLYATGHSFDHFENELWVVYQASGGDTASWWVVFDLTTMVEKTYFRAGKRWTKCFSLIRSGGGRFIYSRSASTGWLAKFDVTTLPAAGSTITETTPPRTEVKYIYASELNGELLVPYDAPTTNTTAYSNTFNILDKDTWSIKRTIRMDTIGAGSEYGTTPYLYKNQGTVMCADGIAIAYGGYYDSENPGTASSDLRIVQGVTIKNADGVNILNGLFDPIGGMSILNSMGKESNRFETEGLYFDSNTGKISTLWHFTDAENGTFLIVEAFSGDENAIDMKPAAIEPRPRLPDIISLWRSDFSKNIPLDPSTGQSLPDVIDICKMMIRYDLRMAVWYATNFSDLTFNGDTFNGTTTFTSSSFVTLERGTNTTCFLKIRNSGMNQEWTISTPESTPTYSQLGMVATQYKFQSTNTGVLCGTGSPEGVVTASPGSIYCNRSGGTTGSVYFKTTGSGNTGWIAK